MTRNEAEAFNRGITAVLAIAEKSATALARDPRRIPIAFAQAALAQLAHDGRHLMVPVDQPKPEAPADAR